MHRERLNPGEGTVAIKAINSVSRRDTGTQGAQGKTRTRTRARARTRILSHSGQREHDDPESSGILIISDIVIPQRTQRKALILIQTQVSMKAMLYPPQGTQGFTGQTYTWGRHRYYRDDVWKGRVPKGRRGKLSSGLKL